MTAPSREKALRRVRDALAPSADSCDKWLALAVLRESPLWSKLSLDDAHRVDQLANGEVKDLVLEDTGILLRVAERWLSR